MPSGGGTISAHRPNQVDVQLGKMTWPSSEDLSAEGDFYDLRDHEWSDVVYMINEERSVLRDAGDVEGLTDIPVEVGCTVPALLIVTLSAVARIPNSNPAPFGRILPPCSTVPTSPAVLSVCVEVTVWPSIMVKLAAAAG